MPGRGAIGDGRSKHRPLFSSTSWRLVVIFAGTSQSRAFALWSAAQTREVLIPASGPLIIAHVSEGSHGIIPEARQAMSVKTLVVDLMREHVFRGDFDRTSVKPDPAGAFHFKDKLLKVSCCPSGRDGWLNCSVTVSLIRGRWPRRKFEPVLLTGFGSAVSLFRPGQWVDYVSNLAEHARELQKIRDDENARRVEGEASKDHEARFGAVDDSSIFKK